jgi:serine/threonine-protein kinase
VQVPEVVGLSLEEAKERITEAGLTVGVETPVYEPTVLEGYVVSQSPQSGTYLEEGLAVDLMVSRGDVGSPVVVVPDLRGQLLEDAKIRVRRLGLTIGNVWGQSDPSLTPWEVMAQNPAPGMQVPQDTPVDFVYNSWGTGQAAEEPPADFGDISRGEGTAGEESVDEDIETGHAAQDAPVDTVKHRPREASVQVTVPPGPDQEVVVIVIDALGAREVYRGIHPGESSITRHVRGYGDNARIQVYVDNFKISETGFPE